MPFLRDTVRGLLSNDSSNQIGGSSQLQLQQGSQRQSFNQSQRYDSRQSYGYNQQQPPFEVESKQGPSTSDSEASSPSSFSSEEPEEWDEPEVEPPSYYRSVIGTGRQYRIVQNNSAQQGPDLYAQQNMYQVVRPLQAAATPPQSFNSRRGSNVQGYFVPVQDDMQTQYNNSRQGGLRGRRGLGGGRRRNQPRRQGLIGMAIGAARSM